ncbi:MAG: alpha/beta hydrolase [Candidatus Omnitrophica bacterium]|nr:alpha/beta hydrolase [Candidatus Omnitrophota bacterium]
MTSTGGNPILTSDQWKAKREDIRQRIIWGLGQAPPAANGPAGDYGAEPIHKAILFGRAGVPDGLVKQSINFGNYVTADLYYRADVPHGGQKIPAVIWLHPVSNSSGYVAGYRRGEPVHLALARAGFAVFTFDQIGNGNRLDEARHFYRRYPQWSLLGKTVQETRTAVDATVQSGFVDSHRIFLLGYGTGGMAALYAAALDDRIAGVVSVAGFTPMRLDAIKKGTGSLAPSQE